MKMRGKPKTPESLSKYLITRTYYYSKKYPRFNKGRLVHGDVALEGRKKLQLEIMARSITDLEISKIFLRMTRLGLPYTTTINKISVYALRKFNGDKTRSSLYLDNLFTHLKNQSLANTAFARKISSNKLNLTENERKKLYERLDHVASGEISVIANTIHLASNSIRLGIDYTKGSVGE